MNKKEYFNKRRSLLNEASRLINAGKINEYHKIEKEIKQLDSRFARTVNSQVFGRGEAYQKAWTKKMQGLDLDKDEQKVFDKVNLEFRNTTQTAKTHNVVVPETIARNIWTEAADYHPIIGDLDMTFVPGTMTILLEEDSGDNAAWYDEDTEVADGDFAIGELNLFGCELAKAIPVSWKLKKMASEAFQKYLTELLGKKMGAALVNGVVSGLGHPAADETHKAQPKGIITAIEEEAGTPQVIPYTEEMSYESLTAAMIKMKSLYKNGSVVYAKSTTVWNQLANILDGVGRPILVNDVTGGGVARIFGIPVKEEDAIPDGAVLIGNVEEGYAINVNEDMTIYVEDHVKKRYTDYMAYTIIDGAPKTTKAFAYIKQAS